MYGSILLILLANSQQGGFAGKALQEHSLCCSFLPAELAKTSNKKEIVRGPAAPQTRLAGKPAE
jgi:hypothetical protein